jgi:hypothetical protein
MSAHSRGPRRFRGASLIEVMVVSAIFFMIVAAIMMIYQASVRVERQVGLKSDIDRTLLAAVRHVDASLRSSRLLKPTRPDEWTEPEPTTSLELKPLRVGDDGFPMVRADGRPEWGTPFLINFAQGDLYRQSSNGDLRILASLGEQGELSFLRPSKGRLRMDVKIGKEGPQGYKTSREISFQFRLFNQ